MIFLQYEKIKRHHAKAENDVSQILLEQEQIFQRTQPKTVTLENEKVKGGSPENKFDAYLTEKEARKIDERLEEAKKIRDEFGELLRAKEKELRASKDITDKIYRCRYLDRMKIRKISHLVSYSEPQIYRILKAIRNMIENDSFPV